MVESLRRRLLRQLVLVGRQCEQANPKKAVLFKALSAR
jgi:hypothetical protein